MYFAAAQNREDEITHTHKRLDPFESNSVGGAALSELEYSPLALHSSLAQQNAKQAGFQRGYSQTKGQRLIGCALSECLSRRALHPWRAVSIAAVAARESAERIPTETASHVLLAGLKSCCNIDSRNNNKLLQNGYIIDFPCPTPWCQKTCSSTQRQQGRWWVPA